MKEPYTITNPYYPDTWKCLRRIFLGMSHTYDDEPEGSVDCYQINRDRVEPSYIVVHRYKKSKTNLINSNHFAETLVSYQTRELADTLMNVIEEGGLKAGEAMIRLMQ
jgi:hypothetical protein